MSGGFDFQRSSNVTYWDHYWCKGQSVKIKSAPCWSPHPVHRWQIKSTGSFSWTFYSGWNTEISFVDLRTWKWGSVRAWCDRYSMISNIIILFGASSQAQAGTSKWLEAPTRDARLTSPSWWSCGANMHLHCLYVIPRSALYVCRGSVVDRSSFPSPGPRKALRSGTLLVYI